MNSAMMQMKDQQLLVKKFDDQAVLNRLLAQEIVTVLEDAVREKGVASIAFSGGSTPVGLFKQLRGMNINWAKVKITLVDDRWVPEQHQDSNAGLLKKHLLTEEFYEQFVSLVTENAEPAAFEAIDALDNKLKTELSELDAAVLGMGADGHTASFFPGSPQLEAALDQQNDQWCIATKPTNAEHDRVTLTLPYLLQTTKLFLHLTGAKKWQVLQEAMQPGSEHEYPVRSVLHQDKAPLTIFYAD